MSRRVTSYVLVSRDAEAPHSLAVWRGDAELVLQDGRWASTTQGRRETEGRLPAEWWGLSVVAGTCVRARLTLTLEHTAAAGAGAG